MGITRCIAIFNARLRVVRIRLNTEAACGMCWFFFFFLVDFFVVAFVFFGIRVLELGIWGELGIIMVFPVA